MTRLRLGTRRSALAQAQSRAVAERIMAAHPSLRVELVLITTQGDERTGEPEKGRAGEPENRRTSETENGRTGEPNVADSPTRPLFQSPALRLSGSKISNLKAEFTKELEDALLANQIDLAVHSLKDMSATMPAGLMLAAFPEREDARDAWVSKHGVKFKELPRGAVVATGAVRRQAQLRHVRPDLNLISIRGNVDTRLRKLAEEPIDGLILAMAGLKRLGRESAATEILGPSLFLPAAGQGCLGLQTRDNDLAVLELLEAVDHAPTRHAVLAERAFLAGLGGDCQTPIAAFAECVEGALRVTGVVLSPDGTEEMRETQEGSAENAEFIGVHLAQQLLERGAAVLLSKFKR